MKWYFLGSKQEITADLVAQIITWHKSEVRDHLTKLWDYFDGEHAIVNRIKPETLKNNKLIINHAKYITEINAGYLLANPIEYSVKGKDTKAIQPILDVYGERIMDNIDRRLAEDASIFGVAYELVYMGEDSLPKSAVVKPTGVILVKSNTVEHEPLFAIVYKEKEQDTNEQNAVGEYEYLTVYTDKEIIQFDSEGKKIINRKWHGFGYIPVIEYLNTNNGKGDFEDVITLIDAYNVLQSDRVNDKEQLVEAILVLYGATMDDDGMAKLRSHRVLEVPEDARLEYLIKSFQEDQMEILRKQIEKDIFKISMTPNMSDENFAGNLSGVAIEFKLIPFEIKLRKKEGEFKAGLRQRFKIYKKILGLLHKPEIPVKPHELNIKFSRALPRNDYETSQMILNLKGMVDTETLLSQLSFVEDAKATYEKAQKEEQQEIEKMEKKQEQEAEPETIVAEDLTKKEQETENEETK